MLNTNDISAALAVSPRAMDQLKLQAKNDPKSAVRAAAQQFEALFLDMMLKSMREASTAEGIFDNDQTRLYTGMMDSQLSQKLSGSKGVGLAEMMAKQLERTVTTSGINLPQNPVPLKKAGSETSLPEVGQVNTSPGDFSSPKDFVNSLWPHAAEAARVTGIPAHFLLGHAALETGWGQKQITGADGTPSYNLFGIKVGVSWKGASVETQTTEFVNGLPQKTIARFRAYGSYAEAFQDYAQILRDSGRYDSLFAAGLDATGFANTLQQGGYATDPMYAGKLMRILNGATLRQALAA